MVPECERVFVAGDVKRPGAFPFLSVGDTTVLQMLALSGRLEPQQGLHLSDGAGESKEEGNRGSLETDSGSKVAGCEARRE
jgi:protein involved in polysaccharide export with SLBB domain